jgi:RNA polymerase sigma-70 factor (ECF subfamily)
VNVAEHDEQFEARLAKRDLDALAEYVEQNRWRLLADIERQLGAALRRKVEPDDIFQEVSVEAVRAFPETDLGERDLFSWLCQLAERRIIDAHRRFFGAQKRNAARESPLSAPSGDGDRTGLINLLVASMTTPSRAFSRNAKEAQLQEALASLPEDQRRAIYLRYVENKPSKEIAEEMGKTDAAVRVMLTRSIKRLQAILVTDSTH